MSPESRTLVVDDRRSSEFAGLGTAGGDAVGRVVAGIVRDGIVKSGLAGDGVGLDVTCVVVPPDEQLSADTDTSTSRVKLKTKRI